MTRYQVKGWNANFENSKSRDRVRCDHVYMPNDSATAALQRLLHESGGLLAFGVFVLICQRISRQRAPREGWLTDDGTQTGEAWEIDDMAFQWRRSESEVGDAVKLLASQQISWLIAPGTNPAPPAGKMPDEDEKPDSSNDDQDGTDYSATAQGAGFDTESGIHLPEKQDYVPRPDDESGTLDPKSGHPALDPQNPALWAENPAAKGVREGVREGGLERSCSNPSPTSDPASVIPDAPPSAVGAPAPPVGEASTTTPPTEDEGEKATGHVWVAMRADYGDAMVEYAHQVVKGNGKRCTATAVRRVLEEHRAKDHQSDVGRMVSKRNSELQAVFDACDAARTIDRPDATTWRVWACEALNTQQLAAAIERVVGDEQTTLRAFERAVTMIQREDAQHDAGKHD